MELTAGMFISLLFMDVSAAVLVFYGSKRSVAFAAHGKSEKMTTNDAMKLPLTGSMVLGGLYVLIKLVNKDMLVFLVFLYLCAISVGTLSAFVRPILGANVLIGSVCCAIVGAFLFTRHWVLNNVLAFSICVVGIEAVQLHKYVTSAVMLVGLFLYDIFWVFGTDVMVTVATTIDGPIKLLFPRDIFGDSDRKSLLGLGDIVIPGFFISQMLRMSLVLYERKRRGLAVGAKSQGVLKSVASSFSILSFQQCAYFHVAFVAYIMSLVNTMVVMVVFDHAQPALLYIVPWLLVSTFLLAVARGEVGVLFGFEEEEPPAQEETTTQQSKGFVRELVGFLFDAVLYVFGLDEETQKAKSPDAPSTSPASPSSFETTLVGDATPAASHEGPTTPLKRPRRKED